MLYIYASRCLAWSSKRGAGEPEWLLEPAPRPGVGTGRPSVTSPSEKEKKKAWSSKQAKALMRATRHVWDGCAIYVAVKERARTGTVVNTTHACMLYV